MRGSSIGVALVLGGVLAPVLAEAAGAADWPQWRGPLSSGVSPEAELPVTWNAEEGVAWSAALAGSGVSSPVITGDLVFVTSQRGRGVLKPGQHPLLARTDPEVAKAERALGVNGGSAATGARAGTDSGAGGPSPGARVVFAIEAFDRVSGRRLWEHRMPAEGELPLVHEKHNLATPSPVTDGERVYAWFGNGQVVALTVEGRRVWQRHLAEENGPFQLDWGHGSSPALHGDLLYLLCYHEPTSYLLAVDKRTGSTRWRIDRDAGVRSYSTPVVVGGPAGDELIVNSTASVDAYDPETGETFVYAAAREPRLLARNPTGGRLVASPAIAGGRLYLRTDDRLISIGAPSR